MSAQEIAPRTFHALGGGSNPHLMTGRHPIDGRALYYWTGPAGPMYRPQPGRPGGPGSESSGWPYGPDLDAPPVPDQYRQAQLRRLWADYGPDGEARP